MLCQFGQTTLWFLRLQKTNWNITVFFMGKIHYFDWAMFSSTWLVYQKVCPMPHFQTHTHTSLNLLVRYPHDYPQISPPFRPFPSDFSVSSPLQGRYQQYITFLPPSYPRYIYIIYIYIVLYIYICIYLRFPS